MDDNVIPIVEQLQRRLVPDNPISQGQGEEDDHPGVRNDIDTGEENGKSPSIIVFCYHRNVCCVIINFVRLK